MTYVEKLAASRMDREVVKLLSNGNFEKAMDIYRKNNIVRKSGISGGAVNRELSELLHYSPLLDLSKAEQKEYLNRIKKLDRLETNKANTKAEMISKLKPGNKDYYLKRHTHNPLKEWKDYSPKEKPGNNYVYGHHGGYHTLDLAINRQNKAVQSALGTRGNDKRLFYTVVDEVKPNEASKTMNRAIKSPNGYSMATSSHYGDVPGAVAFYSKNKAYHDVVGYRSETPLKGKRIIDDVKKGKVRARLKRHDYDDVHKVDLGRTALTTLEADAIKKYKLKDNRYSEAIKHMRDGDYGFLSSF